MKRTTQGSNGRAKQLMIHSAIQILSPARRADLVALIEASSPKIDIKVVSDIEYVLFRRSEVLVSNRIDKVNIVISPTHRATAEDFYHPLVHKLMSHVFSDRNPTEQLFLTESFACMARFYFLDNKSYKSWIQLSLDMYHFYLKLWNEGKINSTQVLKLKYMRNVRTILQFNVFGNIVFAKANGFKNKCRPVLKAEMSSLIQLKTFKNLLLKQGN